MKMTYESNECGRCLGTGSYAGGICWGCNGAKVFLTPQGSEAKVAFESMILDYVGVPVSTLIVGNVIRTKIWTVQGDRFLGNRKVEKIEETPEGTIRLSFSNGAHCTYSPDTLVRLVDSRFSEIIVSIMEDIERDYPAAKIVR